MSTFDPGVEVARELIPPHVRRWLHALASLAGYGLSAVAVGMTTAGVPVPDSVTVSLAILGALVGPLGQLAATNVSPPPGQVIVEPTFLPVGDDPVEADA